MLTGPARPPGSPAAASPVWLGTVQPGLRRRGITPLGYAAFAFALGVTTGLLIRRTVPAMAGPSSLLAGLTDSSCLGNYFLDREGKLPHGDAYVHGRHLLPRPQGGAGVAR